MRTIMSCPFCNGEATVGANEYYDGANTFYIYCTSCGVQQTTTKIRTDEAIAAWNRRAQPENEPIVHCAECEHYTPSPMGGNGCLIRFNGRTEIIPRNPTDFCSHGVRKPERSEG